MMFIIFLPDLSVFIIEAGSVENTEKIPRKYLLKMGNSVIVAIGESLHAARREQKIPERVTI